MIFYLFPGGGGSRMGTGSRKSSHHQRSGSNPINPSSSNSIPSHASAVSATSEDYVDMSPAGSGSGSRPGAVPIPNRNMSSTSLTFGTSPSAGMYYLLFQEFLILTYLIAMIFILNILYIFLRKNVPIGNRQGSRSGTGSGIRRTHVNIVFSSCQYRAGMRRLY